MLAFWVHLPGPAANLTDVKLESGTGVDPHLAEGARESLVEDMADMNPLPGNKFRGMGRGMISERGQ